MVLPLTDADMWRELTRMGAVIGALSTLREIDMYVIANVVKVAKFHGLNPTTLLYAMRARLAACSPCSLLLDRIALLLYLYYE